MAVTEATKSLNKYDFRNTVTITASATSRLRQI